MVLTSDNPRSEDPLAIINDAMVGLQKSGARYKVEPDRRGRDCYGDPRGRSRGHRAAGGQGPRESASHAKTAHSPSTMGRWRGRALREAGYDCGFSGRGKQSMKLPLDRVAEFLSGHRRIRLQSRSPGLFHRFAHLAPGGSVLRGQRGALGWPRLRGAGAGKRRGGAVIRKDQLARYPVKTRLLAVDDTLVALQILAHGGAPPVGQTAGWRNRFGRQDHDQRSDRACSGVALSRAEVRGQFQ